MKMQNYFLIALFCADQIFCSDDIKIAQVANPSLSDYESLFVQFGRKSCATCCQRKPVHKNMTTCFKKHEDLYVQDFRYEAELSEQKSDDRIYFQATLGDELLGFMACQVVSADVVRINYLVIDPEKYDENLVKDLLFELLQVMPKVKKILAWIPASCTDLIDLFQDMGFVQTNATESIALMDIFMDFELAVPSKCSMCQILYGPDFWEQDSEDESDWGTCELNKDGNPCPSSDEEI
ncbi:hypothetical protein A3J41_01145 [candidate division TM6 bacterium RIFCSPHIGHO2_12_FULL_38_8]|nr:MAG: hypothetical protein A3J41_01145 [candidate division TM6 bacterium RIFCSPHIGHO2_12_FULL_38_8]